MARSLLFRPVRAAAAAALAVALGACVNHDYDLADIDATVGLNTRLVAPLAYTHITLGEVLPETWGDFVFEFDGDDIYMVQNDTVNIGQDLVSDMDVFPSSEYSENLTLIIPAGTGTEAQISQTSSITFDDVNTNPNERLDSILCKKGSMRVTFESDLTDLIDQSHVWIDFPDGGIELNREFYPEGRAWFNLVGMNEASLNLEGAVLHLNGTNTVSIRFTGQCHSSTNMAAGTVINIKIYFDEIPGRVYYGNIGTAEDLYGATRTVSFSYTNDMDGKSYFLPFYNPEITFESINNIGVPVTYYVDEMEAYREGETDTVWADFNGSRSTEFTLATPGYDAIAGMSRSALLGMDSETLNRTTTLTFDRENGGTHNLLMLNPDHLRYHYRVRSIDPNTSNVHYFFDDSDIELGVRMRFALWFEGHEEQDDDHNFYMSQRDTTEFSMDSIALGEVTVTDTTYAILKLSYVNCLPAGTTAWVTFTDKAYNPIVKVAPFEIPAATVGSDGYVTAPTDTATVWRRLTYAELDKLSREGAYTVYEYRLANGRKETFRCHKLDWLYGKISLYLEGGVIYEPEAKED